MNGLGFQHAAVVHTAHHVPSACCAQVTLPLPASLPLLPPFQAKEIGGLLTRLTNENAAFLKLKDAAAAARDEALNRVTALEMEVEMLQQQLRWGSC